MTPEQLETRWVTAQGRAVLQRVLADLHDEGSLNLPAILSELEGTAEVANGLDLRYAPLEGVQLDEVNLYEVRDKSVDYLHQGCLDSGEKELLPQDARRPLASWTEPPPWHRRGGGSKPPPPSSKGGWGGFEPLLPF